MKARRQRKPEPQAQPEIVNAAPARAAFHNALQKERSHGTSLSRPTPLSQPLRKATPLPASFYNREPDTVAREMLGAIVYTATDGVVTSGRITETEAYMGPLDPACHAIAGRTKRTWHLFGPPGIAYVYLIYGMYWCLNAVTLEEGFGSAVLIRAIEPIDGVDYMRERRARAKRDKDLANGPGKLCAALGVNRAMDGMPLTGGSAITIVNGTPVPDSDVIIGPRVGITQAVSWPLRFRVASAT